MRIALLLLGLAACTWDTALPGSSIEVEERELVVTDDSPELVALGDGPLSFRHATERAGFDPSRWMSDWAQRLRDEGRPERAALLETVETSKLRLVAIANRTDLSVMPDRAADGGEARLVFALEGRPMTVIFEYAQVGTALEWTKRWHALGTAPDLSAALRELTSRFVETGAIAHVRTADALDGELLLHEFALSNGQLVAENVRNTPDWDRVGEDAVRGFVTENGESLAKGTVVVPSEWLAPSSTLAAPPTWLGGIDPRDALFRQSCGGCHAQTASGFQIDPLARGRARLSAFMTGTELDRRRTWMRLTLSQ